MIQKRLQPQPNPYFQKTSSLLDELQIIQIFRSLPSIFYTILVLYERSQSLRSIRESILRTRILPSHVVDIFLYYFQYLQMVLVYIETPIGLLQGFILYPLDLVLRRNLAKLMFFLLHLAPIGQISMMSLRLQSH